MPSNDTARPRCVQLYLELTTTCNLHCVHCYAHAGEAKRVELPVDLCLSLLRQFAMLGGRYLVLSGGEPTLHSGWPTIAARASELGLETMIITNGMTLPQCAPQLRDLAVGIALSIDSARRDVYESIRCGATFDRLEAGLLALHQTSLEQAVTVCYTPMQPNIRDLPGLCKLMNQRGLHKLYISILELRGRAQSARSQLLLRERDKLEFLRCLYFVYTGGPAPLSISVSNFRGFFERLLGVQYGEPDPFDRTLRVDPWGRAFLTAYLEQDQFCLGNVATEPIRELWAKIHHRGLFGKAREEIHQMCGHCQWFSVCRGGSAMLAYQQHGRLDHPDEWCGAKQRFLAQYEQALGEAEHMVPPKGERGANRHDEMA